VLVSVRQFRLWQLTDVLVGFIVLFVGVYQYQGLLNVWEALAFIAALGMGSVLVYCFWLILTSTAFWIIRVDEMVNLFQGIYAAGRWPVDVYPRWLRNGLTFLVPVAFAVTVPAQALTDRLTPTTLLGTLALTLAFFLLARFVWRLGLRNYSGASA
jgi:ABC-2 type transport system permease protein